MKQLLKPLLAVGFSCLLMSSVGQVISNEIEVFETSPTKLRHEGNDRLTITAEGATVHGKTITSSLEVNGNTKINGLLEAPSGTRTNNSHYEYSRWVGINPGQIKEYIFSTDFSAGFSIEVTLSGNFGPSASTMFTQKFVFNYYQYTNIAYRNGPAVLYQLNTNTNLSDVYLSPNGNNSFKIVVHNKNSQVMNTTVLMNIVTRATPYLSLTN